MGADSIYKIITADGGIYIGKWHEMSETFMTTHHTPNAYPWENTAKDRAWESSWRESLRNYGWNNGQYFKEISMWDLSTVLSNLRTSFRNAGIQNPDSFWRDLMSYWWKQGQDKEIAEALCIMLSIRTPFKNLNTQIDFLTRSFWNESSGKLQIGAVLSEAELQRRASAAVEKAKKDGNLSNIQIWITFKNRFKDVVEEVNKEINKDMRGKKVNLMQEPKIAKVINLTISEKTWASIKRSLKELRDKYTPETKPGWEVIQQEIDDLLKTFKTRPTYSKFVKAIKEGLEVKLIDFLQEKPTLGPQQFIQQLEAWYRKTKLSDILSGGISFSFDNNSSIAQSYKNAFVKHMQENFNTISVRSNRNLTTKRIEDYKNSIESGKGLTPKNVLYYKGKEDWTTLRNKLLNRPFVQNFPYVRNNWSLIYPEQVKLWLHTSLNYYEWDTIFTAGAYVRSVKDVLYF